MSVIEIDWRPDDRKLRQFALVFMCGVGLVGFVVAWRTGLFAGSEHYIIPSVLWAGASGIGIFGLIRPKRIRYVYIIWMAATWPLGWLVSHLTLGIIYFLAFTPVALFFRLIGRDAMCRQFDSKTSTYWVRRGPMPSAKRYFRQF